MDFDTFFRSATGYEPFPYQSRLGSADELPMVLEAPTGSGKTAFAVVSWLWRRSEHSGLRDRTPRRLIYCLPVRSLVEQTVAAVRHWLTNLESANQISVHALLGGEIDELWERAPEKDTVIVGTQDQLLSRALNRGYSMSRYRWPIHFALMNNDVLWIMDEVQLMGVGLSTSAQLQAFREDFGTYGTARTMWMSATVDVDKLLTIDFRRNRPVVMQIDSVDRADARLSKRLHAIKRLQEARASYANSSQQAKALAQEVIDAHVSGTRTLVVVNRVARAQNLFAALEASRTKIPTALLHSRFRPHDRNLLHAEALDSSWTGILVATQAVEAGIDISARTLFTEVAPWPSLVQRFGRCNRAGEFKSGADVFWIDVPDDEKSAKPYERGHVERARRVLASLSNVGIDSLPNVEPDDIGPALPVIRKRDFQQLFDTQPDLSGTDIDISMYVRSTDDRDVQVYWRDWPVDQPPPFRDAPAKEELCSAPFWEVADLARRTREERGIGVAYRWNHLLARWDRADRIVAGMQVLLHTSAGGYSTSLGWSTALRAPVRSFEPDSTKYAVLDADAFEDPGTTQAPRFVSIREHTADVLHQLNLLLVSTAPDVPREELETAALWHDVGKAHDAFQAMLLSASNGNPVQGDGGPWAKSPTGRGGNNSRRFFRHEVASALCLLSCGGSDLAAYLVAAHHGKVRVSLRSRTGEQNRLLGIESGDQVGPLSFGSISMPRVTLDVSVAQMGGGPAGRSWTARVLDLVSQYGPLRLSYLETLVRVADWRGSERINEAAEVLA